MNAVYKIEFPEIDVPEQLVDFLTANGWNDSSWHNDVCVCFT